MATDFLIVGGGIGGLVLAEMLGRGGKRVVVLERSTGPPPWSRPEILWPTTLDLLCTLIPRTRWDEAIVPLAGVELFDGHEFQWLISPDALRRAQVHPWSTNPNLTRELLMRLESFELHRGVEVKEILKNKDRIIGARSRDVATGQEREWLADWTVGDDGGHSLVRQACGIDLKTRLFPLDLLCFGGDWPAEFRPNAGRVWPNYRSARSGIMAAGCLPTAQRQAVGIVPVRPRIFDDVPRAQAAWEEFIEMDPSLKSVVGQRKFPDDFMRVRRPWGHAPRYGGAGALIMGDAAHPVSPAGGQGANASIADGRAIAELALAGERDLLTAYERRRRPANRRSLRFTSGASRLFNLPHRLAFNRFTAGIARQVGRQPQLVARLVRMVSRAFVG
ncbi:MAG TPA: FAD-dependent monooxygenase [Pirellulaceae bacterium]|nr:FAD-dependent monooxygenase [Pirellulaceae bacterium]